MKYLSMIFLLVYTASTECGSPDPIEEPILQTEILDVIVTPETLAVGDTATFRCIIKDSLDTRFTFNWGIHEDDIVPVNGRIDSSVIKFNSFRYIGTSEDSVQEISLSVSADNGDRDLFPPSYIFIFKLKHK